MYYYVILEVYTWKFIKKFKTREQSEIHIKKHNLKAVINLMFYPQAIS